MNKVFVTQTDSRKDFSKAEGFGDLKDVFPKFVTRYDGEILIDHARHVLEHSDPEDYLLLVGDPTLIGICMSVMTDLHGKVNILRWDRDFLKYNPLTLKFYD